MSPKEIESILTVALMAAFADGMKGEREREAVRGVAEALGADAIVEVTERPAPTEVELLDHGARSDIGGW